MSVTYMALDLELEQPKSNPQTPDSLLDEQKIIQVGYVIFKTNPEFVILKKYVKVININIKLSGFIKQLTKITDDDIENGVSLESVYADMVSDRDLYQTSNAIIQWGGGDIEWLKKELPGVGWKFGRSGFNVKHLFQCRQQALGKKWRGGLKSSMGRLGLKWMGKHQHNAMYDALNTAQVYNFLSNGFKTNNKDCK